jgi:hypothetical protein
MECIWYIGLNNSALELPGVLFIFTDFINENFTNIKISLLESNELNNIKGQA